MPWGKLRPIESLPQKQCLDPLNTRRITAGIATTQDVETLQAWTDYESANRQCIQILRRLDTRASAIRSEGN